MSSIDDIKQNLISGNIDGTNDAIQKALDSGLEALDILQEALMPAMQKVGKLFEEGEYFLPEMMMSAESMKTGVKSLEPYLTKTDIKSNGKVIIATVQGDVHDIGKNLVALMIGTAGFELQDMGVDVATEKIVEAVKTSSPDVLALSALLTSTMLEIPIIIESLKTAGLRDKVKILIGGAPVSEAFKEKTGADGYAPDAMSAADAVRSLIEA